MERVFLNDSRVLFEVAVTRWGLGNWGPWGLFANMINSIRSRDSRELPKKKSESKSKR